LPSFYSRSRVIADRLNRKKILIAADLLRFGLLALFPFITAVWQIYTMIFVINAVTAFFTPRSRQAFLKSTLLAEHTMEDERGRAYAAHFALTHACWLITYPAIGHAAAIFGSPVTFTAAGIVCMFVTGVAFALGQGGIGPHTHG
jgi:uncharacterized membrane protein